MKDIKSKEMINPIKLKIEGLKHDLEVIGDILNGEHGNLGFFESAKWERIRQQTQDQIDLINVIQDEAIFATRTSFRELVDKKWHNEKVAWIRRGYLVKVDDAKTRGKLMEVLSDYVDEVLEEILASLESGKKKEEKK